MNLEKNVTRELVKISDEKNINLMEVMRTYVKYFEEINPGVNEDILSFNQEALDKTKDYYIK